MSRQKFKVINSGNLLKMSEHTFRKREGTTDQGIDYEIFSTASIALKLLKDEEISDFHISSNDAALGYFDDIGVRFRLGNQETKKLALQLKHSARQISLNEFKSRRGNFSIPTYFNSFQEIKHLRYTCVLLTNRKINLVGNVRFRFDGENFEVKLTKCSNDDLLRILDEVDCCYQFEIVNTQNSSREQDYENFFTNFFLVTGQKNAGNLKLSLMQNFKNTFDSNEADRYLKAVTEWSLCDGNKAMLDKKWVQNAIASHVLSSRVIPITPNRGTSDNTEILEEAILSSDITIFEEKSIKKVRELFGKIQQQLFENFDEVNRYRSEYSLSSTPISVEYNPSEAKLINTLLWLAGKCPITLKCDQTVLKVVKICEVKRLILLGDFPNEDFPNLSLFRYLSDLKKSNEEGYKPLTQTFTCCIQEKEEISLETLLGENNKFLDFIKTDDLLEMRMGPWEVGEAKEELPEPYIPRYLSRNVVDVIYLQHIKDDTLIILDSVSNLHLLKKKLPTQNFVDVDKYLEEEVANEERNNNRIEVYKPNFTIFISNSECDYCKFKIIQQRYSTLKNFHQFRIQGEEKLEWIRSEGDVSDLRSYKEDEFVEENDLWGTSPDNKINVITSDPGMGKSELMKHLKNKCPPTFWTIIMHPHDVQAILHDAEYRNDPLKSLEHYVYSHKYDYLDERDVEFLKICVEERRVIYIWDAVDELSETNLRLVIDLIQHFSKENVIQWITSRNFLKDFLEKAFTVLVRHIKEFDDTERKNYIKERLRSLHEEQIADIVTNTECLFLSSEHKDILGIPLQIYMLTDLFLCDAQKYEKLLTKEFVLTDLYSCFIEEKFNLHYLGKAKLNPRKRNSKFIVQNLKNKQVKFYKKSALHTVWTNSSEDLLSDYSENEGEVRSVGIITDFQNEVPMFVHKSFAEYLTALHFSENLQSKEFNLENHLFDPRNTNLRFFFDMLLAKGSNAHIYVLYKNYELLSSDWYSLDRLDAGGRNLLHLVASWGQSYPPLEVEQREDIYYIDDHDSNEVVADADEYCKILVFLLFNKSNFLTDSDDLFNFTPLMYAQKNNCLRPQIKIMQKMDLKEEPPRSVNMLYYSAKLGYHDAIQICTNEALPFVKTEKEGNSLLHLSVQFHHFVQLLLQSDCGRLIDHQNYEEKTALHLAAEDNYCKTTELLVEKQANVNIRNKFGESAISVASLRGHNEIFNTLLGSGADVNLADKKGFSPFLVAARGGYINIAYSLIEANVDVNRKNINNATALFIACQQGHREMTIILSNYNDINQPRKDNATPLFVAAQNGHKEVVEELLTKGADVNKSNRNGATPLLVAAQNGYQEIVELLIRHGADINSAMRDGTTPLYAASQKNHEDIVETLIDNGAETNPDRMKPLQVACQEGHLTIVELLLRGGATIDDTLLSTAAQNGHLPVVKLLVTKGARSNSNPICDASKNGYGAVVEFLLDSYDQYNVNSVDDNGTAALHLACEYGHYEVCRILIEKGAQINSSDQSGKTPLAEAAFQGHEKIVELLVSKGAEIDCTNDTNVTPLVLAVEKGHFEIVKFLVIKSANVNHLADHGRSPLYIACYNGWEIIVRFLVKHHADINRGDRVGVTPLHVASLRGFTEIVEFLVGNGADANLASRNGNTPLHAAAKIGSSKMVEILIEHTENINCTNLEGSTPLHLATENGLDEVVKLLLSKNAKNVPDSNQRRPLHLACLEGHTEIVKLLLENGENINCTDARKQTPLHLSVENGHFELVQILFDAGADYNLTDINDCTPCDIANSLASSGNIYQEIADYLSVLDEELPPSVEEERLRERRQNQAIAGPRNQLLRRNP